MQADGLILPLNRPEYVPVPEALISALAWKMFDIPLDRRGAVPVGLVYDGRERSSGSVHVKRTLPEGEMLWSFGKSLNDAGMDSRIDPTDLAAAVVNSVRGIRAERGRVQASSPITPALALMQDLKGVQGKPGPADVGGILEALFSMGSRQPGGATVSELWLKAAERRMSTDRFSKAIDSALQESVLGGDRISAPKLSSPVTTAQRNLYPETPFSWFHETWTRLTSDAWVDALPARVWVDWASTVLRLALGMGYLWEASWYDALARDILGRQATSWEDLRSSLPDPLPWKPAGEATSIRDVAGHAKWRIQRADSIRKLVSRWLAENKAKNDELFSTLDKMSLDFELRNSLSEALNSKKESGKTWEAIRYTLVTRETSGPHADYYGTLKQVGPRYMVVEPGTEWIAVVASLSCPEPGGSCDVGDIMTSLAKLGLRPEISDLIGLLERAGLARGSADADNAVVVQSAF